MKKIVNWIPAIIAMVVIFVLSSVTGGDLNAAGLGKPFLHTDGHFVMFLVLCLCYYKAAKSIFNSILLTVMYGILDETHQIFTPFRQSHFVDIFVDSIGALIAGVLIWKLYPILSKKLKKLLIN